MSISSVYVVAKMHHALAILVWSAQTQIGGAIHVTICVHGADPRDQYVCWVIYLLDGSDPKAVL